jgi:hypothetical protein
MLLITDPDPYNAADPQIDSSGEFQLEIQTGITALQDALEDDLTDAGFVAATTNQALQQSGGLIVPDTLKIDVDEVPGFPNGRLPEDPSMDLLLALLLLNLNVEDMEDFAELPLNPPANDSDFSSVFPHLAAPWQPAE